MTEQTLGLVEQHQRARDAFTRVVDAVDPARWDAPSPCTEWDARGVVEHVIGFHEVLLLRPLEVKAHRPRDDEVARWQATDAALATALAASGILDRTVAGLGGGGTPVRDLLPALTTDVFVHAWDLARAAGVEFDLDKELSAGALDSALRSAGTIRSSGMFDAEVPVPADAPTADRLLGFFGRDPEWTPRPSS
jgi:uncharacterized protein (TIGR03086 family)